MMTDSPRTGPTSQPQGAAEPGVPHDAPAFEGAVPDAVPTTAPPADDPVRSTRASKTWAGIIVFAVVLVALLIFILQNTQSVEISYFGASGNVPLAVAMLLAAVAGVLLTAIAGSLRIWQLRRRLRRTTRARTGGAA